MERNESGPIKHSTKTKNNVSDQPHASLNKYIFSYEVGKPTIVGYNFSNEEKLEMLIKKFKMVYPF